MKTLFVAEVAIPILPCFVGKQTFSKRRFEDETNVEAILGRQSISGKLRLLVPQYIISIHRSGIEYIAYCILLDVFVYNSHHIYIFNFLFFVHLTE